MLLFMRFDRVKIPRHRMEIFTSVLWTALAVVSLFRGSTAQRPNNRDRGFNSQFDSPFSSGREFSSNSPFGTRRGQEDFNAGFSPNPNLEFQPRQLAISSQDDNCGGSLSDSGSFWYPPNYPASYPEYVECRWAIAAAPGSVVQIQFNEPFGLPGRDFLVVMDGIYANRFPTPCSLSQYFTLGAQGQAFILIRADRADYSTFTSTGSTMVVQLCAEGQRGSFVPRIGFRAKYFSIPVAGSITPFIPPTSAPFIPPPPIVAFTPFVPPQTAHTNPVIVWTPPPPSWAPPTTASPSPFKRTHRPRVTTPQPVIQTPFPWTAPPPVMPTPFSPPQPSTGATCGQPIVPPVSGRIIGGNPARLGSWPWMVAVIDARYNGQFCGGVIVDEFWVLTAAHCVVDKPSQNLILRIGATNFNASIGDAGRGVDYRAAFTIIQPSYDGNSFVNDLALIRLSTAVTFSQYVKPVCLPSSQPNDGVVCYIAGYGLTTPMQRKKHEVPSRSMVRVKSFLPHHVNVLASGSSVLMETDIPIVNQATCQNFFSQAFPGLIKVTNSHICAGSVYPVAKDSCNGDSGGPLVCRQSGRYEVAGLTSFGVGCGRSDVFGAYTNVWNLLPWINSIRGLTISG